MQSNTTCNPTQNIANDNSFMPLVLHLPSEILCHISRYLKTPADLSSWSRSCRALYVALTPILYRNVKDDPDVMCWACGMGCLGTVQRLLDAGANPNVGWIENEPRWVTPKRKKPCRSSGPLFQRQPNEDQPLSTSQEAVPECSAEDRDEFHSNLGDWIDIHLDIDHEKTIEYFEEYYFKVADGAERYTEEGFSATGYEPQGRQGPVTGEISPHWQWYRNPRTFSQRCYWSPLHIAAALGSDELVNLLLDYGADVNTLSRLFCACAYPPYPLVAPLWTPFHTAICHGHASTARLLLSRGASINVTTRYHGEDDEHRFTALHSACASDLLDMAQTLVNGGYQTDVMIRDHHELTPFAYAFFRGNWAMINFLLEHGADINAKIGRFNAFGYACLLGYYAEALRLLDLGAVPQRAYDTDEGERSAYFHLAAVAGAPDSPLPRSSQQKEFRPELVSRLIKFGIDVNEIGINGSTALIEAAVLHRADVVKALLHAGANVHVHNFPSTSLCECALDAVSLHVTKVGGTPKGSFLDTVRALLEAMANTPRPTLVKVQTFEAKANETDTIDDREISTVFRRICSLPHKHEDKREVVALLLRYKRAVEIADREPNLVYASILGRNFDISDLLLENGFKPPSNTQFDDLIRQFLDCDVKQGLHYILKRFPALTPRICSGPLLHDAVHAGSEQCVELLINEGVSISSQNKDGESLLLAACKRGEVHTVELLLDKGADPDECTPEGVTLTIIAAVTGDLDMIDLLLEYGASIHSSPPGKPARLNNDNAGFLDVAIACGLVDVVEKICLHEQYTPPTDAEISRHWQNLICARSSVDMHVMIEAVVCSEGFDPDQVIATEIPASGTMLSTPLHLCAAEGLRTDKTELINELLFAGADFHKCLPVRPNTQTNTLEQPFEGTTPLEWAIEWSSIKVVNALINDEFEILGELLGGERPAAEKRDLMLIYAKAVCRRHRPKMLSLLFMKGLDRAIQDENGNTIIHMICDYAEASQPNDRDYWGIGLRAARSIVECLRSGVDYQLKNEKGVSGMERILQIRNYSGDCKFRQSLVLEFQDAIEYVEGASPELKPYYDPDNKMYDSDEPFNTDEDSEASDEDDEDHADEDLSDVDEDDDELENFISVEASQELFISRREYFARYPNDTMVDDDPGPRDPTLLRISFL